MKCLVLVALTVLSQTVSSHPSVGVTVGLTDAAHPVQSLYHSQDNIGQYVYGYATPTISKSETKTADGVTRGGYSYIDSHGLLQTVQYIADAHNGFRVALSNLPQDLPDVAHAKAQHLAEFQAISNDRANIAAAIRYSNPVAVPAGQVAALPQPVQDLPEVVHARAQHLAALQAAYAGAPLQMVADTPEVAHARAEHLAAVEATRIRDAALRAQEISLSPIPNQITNNVVPVHTQLAPVATTGPVHSVVAPVSYTPALWQAPVSSQQHSQSELGAYSYGYVNLHSSKSETQTADGVTRGGYSYIDANGILQTVNYIADKAGFRVAATNLPVDLNTHRAVDAQPIAGAVQVALPAVPVAHAAIPVAHAAPVVATRGNIVHQSPLPSGLYKHEIVY